MEDLERLKCALAPFRELTSALQERKQRILTPPVDTVSVEVSTLSASHVADALVNAVQDESKDVYTVHEGTPMVAKRGETSEQVLALWAALRDGAEAPLVLMRPLEDLSELEQRAHRHTAQPSDSRQGLVGAVAQP